jgi:hypothetical protein
MAKKNLKKTTTPAVTISQPASTSRDDVHTPVTTQFSFFNFITIANTEDIKKFLRLAATTTEGENLKYLWERAYEDGYENGRKSLLRNLEIKMDNKFEEGIEKGMSLGREEGYTVAKEGFDGIINAMRAREASKTTVTTESGIQTDLVLPLLPLSTPKQYHKRPPQHLFPPKRAPTSFIYPPWQLLPSKLIPQQSPPPFPCQQTPFLPNQFLTHLQAHKQRPRRPSTFKYVLPVA